MFYLQKIIAAASMIIKIFLYKSDPVLPFYNSDLDYNNNNNNNSCARCLDANMDSVFFV
jgi:hypothetical protein